MSAAKLPYLIDEICAAVEIYFTGRLGEQYLKTAFILCDDYNELTAKLFLLTDNHRWSDKKPTGGRTNCATPTCGRTACTTDATSQSFKNYHDVLGDVEDVFTRKRVAHLSTVQTIHANMKARRERRNDFFHSTTLLDLGIAHRGVVEAFCDLFAYGELLFGADWQRHVDSSRNLDTMRVLLLIEKASFSDPALWTKAMDVFRTFPRNKPNAARKGVHMTEYPEDFHLRLCVTYGSNILRDKLKALLPAPGPTP